MCACPAAEVKILSSNSPSTLETAMNDLLSAESGWRIHTFSSTGDQYLVWSVLLYKPKE